MEFVTCQVTAVKNFGFSSTKFTLGNGQEAALRRKPSVFGAQNPSFLSGQIEKENE